MKEKKLKEENERKKDQTPIFQLKLNRIATWSRHSNTGNQLTVPCCAYYPRRSHVLTNENTVGESIPPDAQRESERKVCTQV
jgi:hypothetical protein